MADALDPNKLKQEYLDIIDRDDVPEESVHQFLVQYPAFLPLWFPHDNVVFSKLALGNQHIVDFAFGRYNTPGFTWHLIEIEKPHDPLFTKSGNPSAQLTHGLRQLHDWQSWFRDNRDYVARNFPFKEHMQKIGLWKPELLLVIGRRESVDGDNRNLMQQLSQQGVRIVTFDRLVDEFASPACSDESPLRSCRFVNGNVETVTDMSFQYKMFKTEESA